MSAQAAIGWKRSPLVDAAGDEQVVLIVAAMPAELRPLWARIGNCRRVPGLPGAYHGTLGGTQVVAGSTGEGAPAARRGAEALLARFSARALIALGTAAGLSAALGRGAIVAATEVRDGSTVLPPPDPTWVGRLPREIQRGTVVSTARILCTPAEKAAVRRLAPQGPAVADLESAAWVAVAGEHHLPYVVLRAVLDPADERLPFDLNACRDTAGRIGRARVVGRLLFQPGAVRPLWALAGRVSACAVGLADVVERLIRDRARSVCEVGS